MARFGRRPAVEGLDLEPGERVLSSAILPGPVTVTASDRRLLVTRPDQPLWARTWVEVDAVGWGGEDRVLTVVTVDGAAVHVELGKDDQLQLAQVVRERVQASLVTWRAVAVPGGRVRIAMRQGRDGLVVQEIPDPGVVVGGEAARASVDRARRELAASVGAQDSAGGTDHR